MSNFEKELTEAYCYTCSFNEFSNETTKDGQPIYDWADAWWRLLNIKNSYSRNNTGILILEMRQGCRDENGFYPNFVYLVVEKNSGWDFDGLLESLGYKYKKSEHKVMTLFLDYDDTKNIDDVLVETW